jgi:hypothetical protein
MFPVLGCSAGTQQFETPILSFSRSHLGMRTNLLVKPLTGQAANNPNIRQNRGPRKSCVCQTVFFFFRRKTKDKFAPNCLALGLLNRHCVAKSKRELTPRVSDPDIVFSIVR